MLSLISTVAALSAAVFTAAQVTIQVGGPLGQTYNFFPPNVTAANGTVVTFVFAGAPGNHSVTQSTFAQPCDPMASGFDSGFVFIPMNNTAAVPSWNLTITNDQTPIWFYCGQLAPVPHCTQGMVGSINAQADGNRSFSAFKQAAIALNGTTTPGAPVPNLNGVGANATAVPGPISGSISLTGAAAGPTFSGSGIPPSAVMLSSGAGPSGTSAAGSASGAPSASGAGSPSPSSSPSGALANTVNVLFIAIATAFGSLLL
ncbi:hypothetical protein BC835DRAFT_932476 [Cytidiella melzeri]|nr:hypothetical protein BC835DRAFT_932476 [Cytidiella melzeri]